MRKRLLLATLFATVIVGGALVACGEKTPAHKHTLEKTEAIAATCTTDGNAEYYTCSGCGKIYSDASGKTETTLARVKTEKLGHDYKLKYGTTGHWQECSRGDSKLDEIAHDGGKADCTHKAVCTECKQEYGDFRHDHTVFAGWKDDIKPTEEEGASAVMACECGKTDPTYKTVLKLTETSVWSVKSESAANHAGAGSRVYTSAEYGDVTVVLPQVPHVFDQEIASEDYLKTAGDCTAKAVYYKSCECGVASDTLTFEGALDDHKYVEVAENTYLKTAATCTAKAVYYKSCSVCHEKHETQTFESGEKLAHTPEEKAENTYLKTAATCTAKAVYYKSCSVCHEKIETDTFESGEMLAHDYEIKYVWNDDYTECTATEACKNCTDAKTGVQGTVTAEVTKAASCTEEGIKTVSATFTGEDYETQTKTVPIAMLDHTPNEAIKENETLASTTAQGGYDRVVKCSVCGNDISRVHITVLSTPDNTANQMFKRTNVAIEFDRQKDAADGKVTQFVEGVDYLLYYIYTDSAADKSAYVGQFKLYLNYASSMDGSLRCDVDGSIPGDLYFMNGTGEGNNFNRFKAIIENAVETFSPTQRYYFAAQAIAKPDTNYESGAISAIGTFAYYYQFETPLNGNNEAIRMGGAVNVYEFDRMGDNNSLQPKSMFGDVEGFTATNGNPDVREVPDSLLKKVVSYVKLHVYTYENGEAVHQGALKWTGYSISAMNGEAALSLSGCIGNLYVYFDTTNNPLIAMLKIELGDKYDSKTEYHFAVQVIAAADTGFADSEISDVGTFYVQEIPHTHTYVTTVTEVIKEATTTEQGKAIATVTCSDCGKTLASGREMTVLKTPVNDNNQMFKRQSEYIEYDREKIQKEDGTPENVTQFVSGADYLLYYIYTSNGADVNKETDYVGRFKMMRGEIVSMDGTKHCQVFGSTGNYYHELTDDMKAIIHDAIGSAFSPTQRYYFAAQTLGLADAGYIASAISQIGTSAYVEKTATPTAIDELIVMKGKIIEFDRIVEDGNMRSVFSEIEKYSTDGGAGWDTRELYEYNGIDYVALNIYTAADATESVGQLKWYHYYYANETQYINVVVADNGEVMQLLGKVGNTYIDNAKVQFKALLEAALGDAYSADAHYHFSARVMAKTAWKYDSGDESPISTGYFCEAGIAD